jgi:adenine-specific DNA-methyltransferase
MFFTVENAQKIDWIRQKIEDLDLTRQEYAFLLASLIVSADSVSNVPAVYGMYLKNFKDKAKKDLVLKPIHELDVASHPESRVFHQDVLQGGLAGVDAVYLDPPYNERQYSKNYFPLNIIAMKPDVANAQKLHGKTGIPDESFISPFCQKRRVEEAFNTLFRQLDTPWVFLSYSSEGLISRDKMLEIMRRYGHADVTEMDYKRFKSFEYNENKPVTEYLFSLHKS